MPILFSIFACRNRSWLGATSRYRFLPPLKTTYRVSFCLVVSMMSYLVSHHISYLEVLVILHRYCTGTATLSTCEVNSNSTAGTTRGRVQFVVLIFLTVRKKRKYVNCCCKIESFVETRLCTLRVRVRVWSVGVALRWRVQRGTDHSLMKLLIGLFS